MALCERTATKISNKNTFSHFPLQDGGHQRVLDGPCPPFRAHTTASASYRSRAPAGSRARLPRTLPAPRRTTRRNLSRDGRRRRLKPKSFRPGRGWVSSDLCRCQHTYPTGRTPALPAVLTVWTGLAGLLRFGIQTQMNLALLLRDCAPACVCRMSALTTSAGRSWLNG